MINKLATNIPPSSKLVEFKDVLKLPMYILNKVWGSIPPCFTPLDKPKEREGNYVSPSYAHLLC